MFSQLANCHVDYALAENRAASDVGAAWSALDDVRRAALADMAFELGGAGLAGFHHMLAAIRLGDFQTAREQALDSDLAREHAKAGSRRTEQNAAMLADGQWPLIE